MEPSLWAVTTTPSMAPSAAEETTPVNAAGAWSARPIAGIASTRASADMPRRYGDFIDSLPDDEFGFIGCAAVAGRALRILGRFRPVSAYRPVPASPIRVWLGYGGCNPRRSPFGPPGRPPPPPPSPPPLLRT